METARPPQQGVRTSWYFFLSLFIFSPKIKALQKKKSTTPSDNCKHLMTYQTMSTTNCSDFVASNFKMSSQGETVVINIPWIEKKKRKEKKSDYISTSSTSDSTWDTHKHRGDHFQKRNLGILMNVYLCIHSHFRCFSF